MSCVRGLSFLTLLIVLQVFAGEPKRGWTKIEVEPAVTATGAPAAASLREVLHAHGAELVSDYGAFAVAYAPEPALQGLTRSLEARGWAVSQRDELDVLRLPGGDVDTREGLRGAPVAGVSRGYDAAAGLFVIQLAGPPQPRWIAELEKMGWQLARYVPNNAYIAVGRAQMRAATRALPYVQWTEIYHPYQKNALLIRDGSTRALVFDLPTGPAVDATLAAIRAEASGPVRTHATPRATLVYASMSHGRAERLLHQQLVIGVSTEAELRLADERQVTSLTDQLDATGAQPNTASRANYKNWLNARCPHCATMSHAEWQVSVADTGFHSGNENNTHADIVGRIRNGYLTPDATDHSDPVKHGTIVAGIVAGDNALGFRDRVAIGTENDDAPSNMGWFLGTGVAPRAGILVTKALAGSFFGTLNEASLQTWIQDTVLSDHAQGVPRSPRVTIQNHSFEALTGQGFYGNIAAAYDEIVRDANGTFEGHPEVLVTVAAGNVAANDTNWDVSAGAMAKNVLTVSGVENWRTFPTRAGCTSGNGFRNIMSNSRIGTKIDQYFKPDVLAPASQIVSLYSPVGENVQVGPTVCPKHVRGYYDLDSDDSNDDEYIARKGGGTSFAAPVGAGAALLAKRHLASSPQAMSPALTKAVLIAGARSIKGGQNLTTNPAFGTTVTSVPSEMQGFGRLSLTDILTDPKPLTVEQADSRALYGSGMVKSATFRVRDHNQPVKLVLAWSDAPGNPNETNPNVSALVNDLDLEIQAANGTVIYLGNRMTTSETSIGHTAQGPFVRDHVNNVEYVRFSLTQPNEEFVVKIRATQITAGAIPGIRYGFVDENGVEHVSSIVQDWALAGVNAEQISPFPVALPSGIAPGRATNLQATASGNTVSLTWSPGEDATRYLVQRKTGPGSWQDVLPYVSGSSTSTTDVPASVSGVMLYRVIAVGTMGASEPSNVDVAFVGTWIDAVPTVIKAEHIAEVRRAVNGLREVGGQAPIYSASDTNANLLRGQAISSAAWTTLMAELSSARLAAGVPSGCSFRVPAPASGIPINRSHIEDLRLGFQ